MRSCSTNSPTECSVSEERNKVAAAADVLGTHQHKLAESRGRSPDVPITMGSELDGLRRLAAWMKDHPPLEHAEPVIAAGANAKMPARHGQSHWN